MPIELGAGPPIFVAQPSSVPSARPGKIVSPVLEWTVGLVTFCTVSTCSAVRQEEESSPLQESVLKSKLHTPGSPMRSSFSPSNVSQALSTAWWIIAYFEGG